MQSFMFALTLIGLLTACGESSFSSSSRKQPAKKDQPEIAEDEPTPEPKKPVESADQKAEIETDEDERVVDSTIDDFDDRFDCKRDQPGFIGKVYALPEGTSRLPDFTTMQALGQITAQGLNIPTRNFEAGFPGVPGMIEWFGVRFEAKLKIEKEGDYSFMTVSDDGSKVFLGKELIVNNDGLHPAVAVESKSIHLKKGTQRLAIDWYQGPRIQIALSLFWKVPGKTWEVVPASVLKHGEACDLPVVGSL